MAGTAVYSPVDGKVMSIRPYVIDGTAHGSVIEIQPTATPADVVTLTNLSADAGDRGRLARAGRARPSSGTIVDLSKVLSQEMAKYTSDAGNHVHIEVGPAPADERLLLARPVRILFIADAFATPGRRIIEQQVPRLRAEREIGFVVANGENLADGTGITSRLARRLHGAGVDVITLGNHAFRQREVYEHLGLDARIVRPANYPSTAPGQGLVRRQRRRRHAGGGHQPPRQAVPGSRREPVRGGRGSRPPGPRAGGDRARRLPRRGDQREGGDGPASRRAA